MEVAELDNHDEQADTREQPSELPPQPQPDPAYTPLLTSLSHDYYTSKPNQPTAHLLQTYLQHLPVKEYPAHLHLFVEHVENIAQRAVAYGKSSQYSAAWQAMANDFVQLFCKGKVKAYTPVVNAAMRICEIYEVNRGDPQLCIQLTNQCANYVLQHNVKDLAACKVIRMWVAHGESSLENKAMKSKQQMTSSNGFSSLKVQTKNKSSASIPSSKNPTSATKSYLPSVTRHNLIELTRDNIAKLQTLVTATTTALTKYDLPKDQKTLTKRLALEREELLLNLEHLFRLISTREQYAYLIKYYLDKYTVEEGRVGDSALSNRIDRNERIRGYMGWGGEIDGDMGEVDGDGVDREGM